MIEVRRRGLVRVLEGLVAAAALVASAAGVAYPDLYRTAMPQPILTFVFGQDIVTLAASIALLALWRRAGAKATVAKAGLVAYLFYAYGPLAMGTVYTVFYFAYLAVLGLAIFYFIAVFSGIAFERLRFAMPAALRLAVAAYCAGIAVYFAPQWVIAIAHNIATQSGPAKTGFDFIYYVYVLDLCFVLPVSVIAAWLLLRQKVLGTVLGGTLLVFGAVLMLSVAMGYYCQPMFGQAVDTANAVQFSILTGLFVVLGGLFFAVTTLAPADPAMPGDGG